MANTYTQNLGLIKPGINDPASTNLWGGFLNTDEDLIDTAIAGYLSLSVAGAANVVLTSTQGAADQSRYSNYKFTGVLTGNIIVFFPQSMGRNFSVWNATTGAFTLTVAVSNGAGPPAPAGTTTVVTQGATQTLASDGTNILARNTSSPSAQGIAGDSRNSSASLAAAGTTVAFTADQILVGTALAGSLYGLASYSQTLNVATTGAGGMDTGTAPVSSFVSIYAIYNPLTSATSILACAIGTSSGTIYSGANLPSGYTASALIAVWPTNGSSQLVPAAVKGRAISIQPVTVVSGGSPSTYSPVSLASAVPVNAVTVNGCVSLFSSGSGGGAIYIASSGSGTAAGVGELQFALVVSPQATPNLEVPFYSLLLGTAQQLVYRIPGVAGESGTIIINGYSI